MNPVLGGLLLLMAAPFWESHPAKEWSDAQLQALLTESPWAQMVGGPGQSALPVNVRLTTASPIEQAERELARRIALRTKPVPNDSGPTEYGLWLEDNRANSIVLSIRMASNQGFLDDREVRRMEDESVMRIGKRSIKMTGHFPPVGADPFLRIAFPREVQLSDKLVTFDLYLPGVSAPFRTVEFNLKDMVVGGKLEM